MELTTINSQNNQNYLDLAIQEYGSLEGLFDLLDANDLQLTSQKDPDPYAPVALQGNIQNRFIYNYYKSNDIRPATAVAEEELCLLSGIGYMTLALDFIVR